MAVTIGRNLAAQGIIRAMSATADAKATQAERLASGQRINRASDDAAGLAIAEKLRVNSRVYTQGVRNVNDVLGYLAIADSSLNSLKGIATRIAELAEQSSSGTFSTQQRRALDNEAQQLSSEYSRIIASTTFNGTQIWSSTGNSITAQVGYSPLQVVLGENTVTSVGSGTYTNSTLAASTQNGTTESADFNGDGKLDLLTGSLSGAGYNVFLGNGNGTFQNVLTIASVGNVSSATSGDVDGNGTIDIIGFNFFPGFVEVFKGNGNGTFQASQTIGGGTAAPFATGIAAGDVDGDGDIDVFTTANNSGSGLYFYRNNGSGTFAAMQTIDSSSVTDPTLADVNRDGILDVIIGRDNVAAVRVLISNGNGTFQAAANYATSWSVSDLTVADVNGDHYGDLLVASSSLGKLDILLNNGNGTFGAATSFTVGTDVHGVATGDFNSDGKLDAVLTSQTDDKLYTLFGNGNGTFGAPRSQSVSNNPLRLVAGDFNGDQVSDVAVGSYGTGAMDIFINQTSQTGTVITVEDLENVDLLTRSSSLSTLDSIQNTLAQLNVVGGSIGSSITRLQTASNVLQVMGVAFQEAQSRIVDADVAVEAANQVRLAILGETQAALLAQAKRSPEIALTLLQLR